MTCSVSDYGNPPAIPDSFHGHCLPSCHNISLPMFRRTVRRENDQYPADLEYKIEDHGQGDTER